MADINVNYLDKTGLASLWAKIKTFLSGNYVPSTRTINGYDLSEDRDFFLAKKLTLIPETWEQYTAGFSTEIAFDVKGVDANDFVFVAPEADSMKEYYDCNVRCCNQETDKLYFCADTAFEADLVVNILIVKVEGTEVSS